MVNYYTDDLLEKLKDQATKEVATYLSDAADYAKLSYGATLSQMIQEYNDIAATDIDFWKQAKDKWPNPQNLIDDIWFEISGEKRRRYMNGNLF